MKLIGYVIFVVVFLFVVFAVFQPEINLEQLTYKPILEGKEVLFDEQTETWKTEQIGENTFKTTLGIDNDVEYRYVLSNNTDISWYTNSSIGMDYNYTFIK